MLKKILIVDDFEGNRELLTDLLEEYYEIDTAENGQEAIEKLESSVKYSAMLLDLMMPVIDGFGVLEYMNAHQKADRTPVIVISGDSTAETEAKCLDLGVEDFIAKPFKAKIILKRLDNVIALHEYQNSLKGEIAQKNIELEIQNEKLREMNINIIDILGNMVESRNMESGTHVKRVKGFTKILGTQLMKDFPEYGLTPQRVELITQAAALHDIGKIMIPDSVLLKPGRLTAEEFELMKTHTTKGCQVLDTIEGVWDEDYHQTCYEICRYHHEKYDGRGYPDGLVGEQIPVSAQLVSVADCYDALVTERVYKAAFSKEKAFQMITGGECGAFSPKLMTAFAHAKDAFEAYVDESKNIK